MCDSKSGRLFDKEDIFCGEEGRGTVKYLIYFNIVWDISHYPSWHLDVPLRTSKLISFKLQTPPLKTRAMNQSEKTSLSNSRWQNRRERPNRSTNNGKIAYKAKSPVSEGVNL